MDNRPPVVLVVDASPSGRDTLRAILGPRGVDCREAGGPEAALAELSRTRPDLVLLDPGPGPASGPGLVHLLRERLPDIPLIVVTARRDAGAAAGAVRQGVYDCLPKPVNANALLLSVNRALEEKRLKDELRILKGRLSERASLRERMGDSDAVRALVRMLEKIAPTPFTVLIEGESGAGKELVARAIHDMSGASGGQFVAVDCGAIPDSLFESELFGHVKGAFTGAAGDKTGFFEAADNGTLFLDEVCNLSCAAQRKLLRAIEERQIRKIGSTVPRAVNVRIIAAANRPLEKDVENRLFRVDLLYRLKEVSVKVPPLRDRPEDVSYLASRFLEEFREKLGIRNPGLSREAVLALADYPWPGNVRELKNVMRQAALICEEGRTVQPRHLSFHADAAAAAAAAPEPAAAVPDSPESFAALPQGTLADIVGEYGRRLEKRLIELAIREAGGNKSAAARRLGIDYTTLHRKRKQLGIE